MPLCTAGSRRPRNVKRQCHAFSLPARTYKLSSLVAYIVNLLASCASSHGARTSPSSGATRTTSARVCWAYPSSYGPRKWKESRSEGLGVSERSWRRACRRARSSVSRRSVVGGTNVVLWVSIPPCSPLPCGFGGDHATASHVLVRSAIANGIKDIRAPMNAREVLCAYNTCR